MKLPFSCLHSYSNGFAQITHPTDWQYLSKLSDITNFVFVWIVMTGILGNYLYFDHSVRQIQKITSVTSDPNAIREQLAKKGGMLWAGAIGVSIVIIALSVLMTYFFAPAWYCLDY